MCEKNKGILYNNLLVPHLRHLQNVKLQYWLEKGKTRIVYVEALKR